MLLVPWIISDRKFYKWLREQKKEWDYICGHFEFKGGQISQQLTSWQGMNAKIVEEFAKKKVLSGHFHLKRHFTDKTFYIGSPLSLTWADVGEEKSIYVLDTETDDFTEINNELSPKFAKILLSEMSKNKVELINNNFVKIILDIPIDEMKLQQLVDVLRSKAPLSLQTTEMGYDLLSKDASLEIMEFNDPWVFVEKYLEGFKSISFTTNDSLEIQGWYTNDTDTLVIIVHGHGDHSDIMRTRYDSLFDNFDRFLYNTCLDHIVVSVYCWCDIARIRLARAMGLSGES